MEFIKYTNELNSVGDREKEILTEYNSRPENLDYSRINRFRKKEGFANTSIFYIPETQRSEVVQKLGQGFESYNTIGYACYNLSMNCIIAFYDIDFIDLNGPAVFEGLIIHEYAHANLSFVRFNELGPLEMGLTGKWNGSPNYENLILEEAYADYYRGKYMKENLQRRVLEFEKDNDPDLLFEVLGSEPGTSAKVRNKYLYLSKGNNLDFNASTIPANGLEDLLEKFPELIKYFNLIRIFPQLKLTLAANFNKLFPKSEDAFSSISNLPFVNTNSGYCFYKQVQTIIQENP